MAETKGAPSILTGIGGATARTGPTAGHYHIKVGEVSLIKSQNSGRYGVQLKMLGTEEDTAHPNKVGKTVIVHRAYGAMEGDDADKANTMRVMIRRMFVGFEVEWPASNTPFEEINWSELFLDKEAWITIKDQPDKRTEGEMRPQVVAISQDSSKLPNLTSSEEVAGEKGAKAKKVSKRR